jgi:hypothetical protein
VVLAIAIVGWSRRIAARRRARRRAARAIEGERSAEHLLAELGYRVVARQVAITWYIAVDGERWGIDLRADLLADRDGRRYVAEVKTGAIAPSIAHAATRRQLLEYLVAYRVDGVLLVDAESGDVLEVEFGQRIAPTDPRPAVKTLE